MVARGDLGVELPLEQVPVLQKMMIRICNEACKPVITATQMLESMTKNPRPTRAEVSDVANAIYDSTGAVMLSGETAVGLYPIETVAMMRKIVEEAEHDCDYRSYFENESQGDHHGVSLSVALSSVQTAYNAGARAIFASSSSGFTVNLISRFRPEMPIFAQTPNPAIYHRLALSWGVHPIPPRSAANVKEAILACSCYAMNQGCLKWGDLIVMTAGYLFGVSGTTNMMMLENIGDVVVRGAPGFGNRVVGKIYLLLSAAEKKFAVPAGSIVVMARCELAMAPHLRGAAGIILQNHPQDPHSEKCAMELAEKLGLSLIVRAAGAFNMLQEGMLVTLDPQRGLVFKGEVRSDEEMISSTCPVS
jgi:pyruvate kinase